MVKYLYVVKCESDDGHKYYVSTTTNTVDELIKNNFGRDFIDEDSEFGQWINNCEPEEIIEHVPLKNISDVDNKVLLLMAMHGIDNVRGGSFVKEDFDESQMKLINNLIKSNIMYCTECKTTAHTTTTCEEMKKAESKKIYDSIDIDYKSLMIVHKKEDLENTTLMPKSLLFYDKIVFDSCCVCPSFGRTGKYLFFKPYKCLRDVDSLIINVSQVDTYNIEHCINLDYLIGLRTVYVNFGKKRTTETKTTKVQAPAKAAGKVKSNTDINEKDNSISYKYNSGVTTTINFITDNKIKIITIDLDTFKNIVKKAIYE